MHTTRPDKHGRVFLVPSKVTCSVRFCTVRTLDKSQDTRLTRPYLPGHPVYPEFKTGLRLKLLQM